MPISFKAALTSSSLKGLIMASIFFILVSPGLNLIEFKGPFAVNGAVQSRDFGFPVYPEPPGHQGGDQDDNQGAGGREGDGGRDGDKLNYHLAWIAVKQTRRAP